MRNICGKIYVVSFIIYSWSPYLDPFLQCHKAEHRENNKTRQDTGATVDEAHQEGISETQQQHSLAK